MASIKVAVCGGSLRRDSFNRPLVPDAASRPRGAPAFAGRPGTVLGASAAVMGTALAWQHLRNVLAYPAVAVLLQPEVFIKFSNRLIDDQGHVSARQYPEMPPASCRTLCRLAA